MTEARYRAPAIGTRWRHYKSKGGDDHTYEVVGIAKHSETDEELVVYRPLYGVPPESWVHGFDFAARPLSMWFDPIEWNGVVTPRFVPA